MAQALLLNPRKRRAAPKRRKASRSRRRNPIAALRRSHSALSGRRRRAGARRRRNPIGLSMGGRGMFAMVGPVVAGAVGGVVLDAVWAKISPSLPPSLQRVPGKVGVGDAIKLGATLFLGKALNRATKGMSSKAAAGAAIVQVYNIVANMVPPGTLGWYSPYPVVRGNQRIGPTRMGAFTAGGTPLLAGGVGAFVPGSTPLLAGSPNNARSREGFAVR